MALTTQQKISLFEIIDTPYTGDVDAMYGTYGLAALTHSITDNINKVQLKIFNRLDVLTSEEETVLVNYIAEWESLGTQSWILDGGTDGISGIADSPSAQRDVIQRRVKNLVPVRHYWETVENQQQNKSISINTVRGS